jgi:hypothetical protein
MDGFDDAARNLSYSDIPIPIPRAPRAPRWSGWLIGAALGVLASLWAFPAVRYTLTAQMEFAVAEDSVPWISGLDAQRTAREEPRLDLVASKNPDDYLLQVGRATAIATAGGGERGPWRARTGRPGGFSQSDRALSRLGAITRVFSTTPGAYAHLARYLMADRVRIQRPELAPGRPGQERGAPEADAAAPSQRSLAIMLWALNSGERLDSGNAFWPAMLSATYFASGQDQDALAALARAARMPRWDAYIYEEVLGQWRLYSAAYGDHGATQKIGPLSLVVFPHLHEIRRMAEMARWHADRAAAQGQDAAAARIRRNLARLGVNLRDNAGWAFEALYGTDLFFIACTDADSKLTPSRIRTPSEWEAQAVGYHRLLKSLNREFEFRLIRSEVQNSCDLRKRVDLARYDASYPGIPPGIPLMPLFGNWMGGICLVQQALGLLFLVALAWAWSRQGKGAEGRLVSRGSVAIALVAIGTVAAGVVFFTVLTTPRMAGLMLMGSAVLVVAGLDWLWRLMGRIGAGRSGLRAGAVVEPLSRENVGQGDMAAKIGKAARRWTHGTTVRMLLLIVLPYLAILYTHRGELSSLHPVAILLTSLIGVPRASGVQDSLQLALLSSALPLALPLACALWGFYRGVSPAAAALLGLRRLALPCLVCLVAAYAILLNRMLVLDAEASQAIQKAAQNDRQWVLTHGAENPF